MFRKIVEGVLVLQLVFSFLAMMVLFRVALESGRLAAETERFAGALNGENNEFQDRDSQSRLAKEVAGWFSEYSGTVVPIAYLCCVFLMISSALGFAVVHRQSSGSK